MAILAWTMMAIALWHFTVWIPDRFWGGIVGAFVGGLIGSLIVAFLLNGLSVPSRDATDIMTSLQAIPGAVIGTAVVYLIGVRKGTEPLEL